MAEAEARTHMRPWPTHTWTTISIVCAGCCSDRGNGMNSRSNGDRLAWSCIKVALFHDFSRKIGQNQKSAIVTACSFEFNKQWRSPICELANYNNRYSKWKYRWARGQKSIFAKIAAFAFGFFALLLANLVRCVPAQIRKFWAGALGNTPYLGLLPMTFSNNQQC